MSFRIGFGYDVHRLAENETLILGGINIPHTKGTIAHSDGDVLIHAICDALLGAANLRDIGFHFPDSSKEFKNADSIELLKSVLKMIEKEGYSIGNIDSTICLQRPKIKDFIPEMQKEIAKRTGIQENQISIKATTTEQLGFVGTEEGISAYCVVLINQK